MSCPLIIAIDGPSGAGKSTLGRMLARELNLLYLDTGSMYRAVALAVMESSVNAQDDVAVGSLASRVQIDLHGDPDAIRVTLEGRDVTDAIRDEAVTYLSSVISTVPAVRRAMVMRQREIGKRGAVLNGRDIGTVVFPDADVKFFLTAIPEERAQRRFHELRAQQGQGQGQEAGAGGRRQEQGQEAGAGAGGRRQPGISFEETLADMCERDERDTTRADSPLVAAKDAIVLDSTGLSITDVFEKMMSEINMRTSRLD